MFNVAVLIPTYKPGDYLRRCLQSIDSQTLSQDKYKVYIALNGPKENFEEVVFSALKSIHFEYEFFYLEKAGVSNARNFLITRSIEDYIVFVDDDDVLSSNYLTDLLSVTNSDFMGICNTKSFEVSVEAAKENFMSQSYVNLKSVEVSKFKSRKYYSSPCAKMLHRKMIGKYRFDERVKHGEDALFMATISKNIAGVQKVSSDACYYVYERPNSASRKKPNRLEELKRIQYLTVKYIKFFFRPGYSKLFIATRVAATFIYVRRVF